MRSGTVTTDRLVWWDSLVSYPNSSGTSLVGAKVAPQKWEVWENGKENLHHHHHSRTRQAFSLLAGLCKPARLLGDDTGQQDWNENKNGKHDITADSMTGRENETTV